MSQAKELAMVTPDNIPIAQGLCRRSVDIVTLSRAEEGLSSVEEVQIDAVEWAPGKQEYAVMVTIATISLMVALDATILVPALPALALDLGGSASDAFWAGTSYLLTCAVFQPFIAAISDLFGRKEMLLVSLGFFTLGTLLCAPLAHNFTVLLAGRSLQGIGGGGIITMGQVIFADIVPLRQRPKYFSVVLAAWALGSVMGPLIGGLFVEGTTWRWCFYINFPFCVLGFVMVPICVKLQTAKSSFVSKLARVDWVGSFLFIGGMTSFLIGLSWAGVQYEWASIQTLVPIIIGANAVVAAVAWEIFYAKEPMLRPWLFSSPSAIAAYACAFGQGFLLFCGLYYMPFYFSAAKSHGPIVCGLDLLPVTGFLLPGSIVVSILTTRTGRFRWALWLGWATTALSAGLFLLFDVDTPTPVWVVILAIFGVGNGMVLTSVNVAIQAISKAEDCGRAAAMYAFMRTLGMTVGVAVGGTTFQNVMSHKLHELGLPDAIAKNAEAFVFRLWYLQDNDPVRIGSLQSYIEGFHGVFWVMTGTAVAGLVASLFIKRHSMDKPLETHFTLQGGVADVQMPDPTTQMWETKSGHTSMTSSTASVWVSAATQTHDEKSDTKAQATELSSQRESQKVEAFLVGPGGWRVPIDPLSGAPLPPPRRISQISMSESMPQVPEAVHSTSDSERKRISPILAEFS